MKTNVVNQLFKQKYWIRFELGISGLEEKAYFNEVMQRSYSICNFLFSKNDEVYVINRISYLKEDSMHEKLDMHRYFKTKRAVKHLEHQVFPYEYEDDEQMVTSEYRVIIHIVSSDAHHLERRGSRLREVYDAIHESMGEAWVSFFLNNAQYVIGNKTFGRRLVEALSSRGVWSRLFSYFQNK